MHWVVKYLEEGMEIERVQELGLVVVDVVRSPSSALLGNSRRVEVRSSLSSSRRRSFLTISSVLIVGGAGVGSGFAAGAGVVEGGN